MPIVKICRTKQANLFGLVYFDDCRGLVYRILFSSFFWFLDWWYKGVLVIDTIIELQGAQRPFFHQPTIPMKDLDENNDSVLHNSLSYPLWQDLLPLPIPTSAPTV